MRGAGISNFGGMTVAPAIVLASTSALGQSTQYTVPSLSTLQSFSVSSSMTPSLVVTREGYTAAGDGGYAQYYFVTGSPPNPCPNNDGGYQVANTISVAGCFYAIVPPRGLPIAVWGALPSTAGTAGTANVTALTTALATAAANNIPLWCGPGTYTLQSAVLVPSNTALNAEPGTCELLSAASNNGGSTSLAGLLYTAAGTTPGASHIRVRGLTLSGNLPNIPAANANNQLSASLVTINGGDDVVFENDRWQDSAAVGITFNGSSASVIRSGVRNSTFHNVGMYWHVATLVSGRVASQVGTLLTFSGAAPAGVVTGMSVADATNPGSISTTTTVSSVGGSTVGLSSGGSAALLDTIVFGPPVFTSPSVTQSSTTLTFAAVPANLSKGMSVSDMSNPVAIPPNTTLSGVSGSTLTLSAPGSASTADTIVIGTPYFETLVAASTSPTLTFGLNVANFLAPGMRAFDSNNITAVSHTATIASVTGSTVVLSESPIGTLSSGNTIVFSNGYNNANQAIVFTGGTGTTANSRADFVIGNIFDQIGADAVDISGVSNFLFSKNTCDLAQSGWQAESNAHLNYGFSCLGIGAATNSVVVSGNVVDGATGDCLSTLGTQTGTAYNLDITANVIQNCGGAGISLAGVQGFYVGGNTILNTFLSSAGYTFKNANIGAVTFLGSSSVNEGMASVVMQTTLRVNGPGTMIMPPPCPARD